MKPTKVFNKTAEAYYQGYRLIVNRGGTRSGKSFSILQLLFIIALYYEGDIPLVIGCFSKTSPHIRRGIARDFANIVSSEGYKLKDVRTQNPDTYTFGSVTIEFIGMDDPDKAKGPQIDIAFINECNEISHALFRQISQRTSRTIFLDYNPDATFWLDEQGYLKLPTTKEITGKVICQR